jgi:GT2 family glycosyltransferase
MMNVSVSIVIYKHKIEQIARLVEAIIVSPLIRILYIIDNSPVNELEAHINFPKTEYFFLNKNGGYGAGHNFALRKAQALDTKYHLVVNPDVIFDPIIFESIVEFMNRNPDIGNLMPKVLYPDGSIQYVCKLLPTPYDWIGRRFNPFKSFVEKRNELFELRNTGYNRVMDIPYLSGCFMFLRISALRHIGLFDTRIFMYGEETDLCRRLITKGYRTVFYPEVFIFHEFQKGSHKSFRLTWIGIKSAVYYFNKWGWVFDREREEINKITLNKLGLKNGNTHYRV